MLDLYAIMLRRLIVVPTMYLFEDHRSEEKLKGTVIQQYQHTGLKGLPSNLNLNVLPGTTKM